MRTFDTSNTALRTISAPQDLLEAGLSGPHAMYIDAHDQIWTAYWDPTQFGKPTRVVFVACDLTGHEVTRVDTVLADTFASSFGYIQPALGVDQEGGIQLAYYAPDLGAISRSARPAWNSPPPPFPRGATRVGVTT